MGSRYSLQLKLETVHGNEYVYYDPPSGTRMRYPAIVYRLTDIDTKHADDKKYFKHRRYVVTLITLDPDPSEVDELLDSFEYIAFDRHYTSSDLHHYVFILYY